jgi:hypothetical protein
LTIAHAENAAAEQASGPKSCEDAERAEQGATNAIRLFSKSFAWSEYAYSLEERGDA